MVRTLRSLLLAGFAVVSITAAAAAQQTQHTQMVPIPSNIASRSQPEIARAALRCSGLFAAISAVLADNELKRLQTTYEERAETLYQTAARIDRSASKETVDRIGKVYLDRIVEVRSRTSDMFSDKLIADDFSACKTLVGLP